MRADLPAGLQVAQVAHAGIEFAIDHPDIVREWNRASNNIVIVNVPNEKALAELSRVAAERDIKQKLMIEPDLGDEMTAMALEPGNAARRLCSSYPLALREAAMSPAA